MTANELRKQFNEMYGIGIWPAKYEVDHETYANVCQLIFDNSVLLDEDTENQHAIIFFGPNRGIRFKNVELILVKGKERK